jgi:DnaK suppressor protein
MAKARKKTPKQLAAASEKLHSEREDLLHQIAELEARASGDEEDAYDDEAEPETATYERERDLSLLENARLLLDQVDSALAKVADGSYGICTSCGKGIEAARLRALPHASLCIECKRREERR